MSAIPVTCPNCRAEYHVPAAFAGKKGRCKQCRSLVLVPRAVVPAAPAPRRNPPERGAPVGAEPAPLAPASRAALPRTAPVRWPWVVVGTVVLLTVASLAVLVGSLGRRPTTKTAAADVKPAPTAPADEHKDVEKNQPAAVPPPAPAPAPAPPPPDPAALAREKADKAFAEVQKLETNSGEDYEAVVAAYQRFLTENPSAPASHQDKARHKIDVDLPAKIDDRDFQRATAAARSTDAAKVRSVWEAFLAAHPKSRHAAEAREALEGLYTWKAKLVKATLAPTYPLDGEDFTYRPSKADSQIAVVTVEFEATSAAPGTLEDRLKAGGNSLSEDAIGFFLHKGKIIRQWGQFMMDDPARRSKPSRLFVSDQVELGLPDGTHVSPGVTSKPESFNYGVTSFGDKSSLHIGTPDEDTPVIRFVRGEGITGVLVQPHRKVVLTLAYVVPDNVKKATLRFYDCAPIDVAFSP